MTKSTIHLNAEQLASLFTQLHHLESAGLPCLQAFSILSHSESQLKKPLLFIQQQIKAGRSVSEAGFRAGIFNDVHKTLLHAAESSGRLAEVYEQLASYYTGLASRIRKIKSRLYLPILILSLALFIKPIPALINSSISIVEYLQLSLGRLLEIGLLVFLLLSIPRIFRNLGAEAVWHRLQLSTPVVKQWVIKHQINEFFFILALMLESGVTFSDALPKAVASIKNTQLRKAFKPALAMLSSGRSVTDTLSEVSVMSSTMLQIVASNEQSGKLASGVLHFTKIEAEDIGLQDDTLAEWLPRIVYTMIAAWMAYSILGSSFTTIVPNDL